MARPAWGIGWWRGLSASVLMAVAAPQAHAEWLNLCDRPLDLSAVQQDRLFRFAGLIKEALNRSGGEVALVARSGLDLDRFGIRYSHTGIALARHDTAPWAVRQLYYDCTERQPRLFDQGMSGFLLGLRDAERGHVSVLILPSPAGQAVARAALDAHQAAQVLGSRYSANAHAFSDRYQNCNQWVAELLALAWGAPADVRWTRAQAQDWLQTQGYEPTRVDVGSRWVMWAGALLPFIHTDDHPEADVAARQLRVSLPAAIEAFAHQQVPGVRRIEFCHAGARAVIHEGWTPVSDACEPGEGDRVVALD